MNKTFKFIIIIFLLVIAGMGGYILRGESKGTITSTAGSNETDATNKSETSYTTSGKTADYSSKSLSEFPKSILSDNSITELDLSNNNLTGSIPAEIHDLTNLVILNLSNNQMTGIPAEVGQLKKLRILDYSNNQLTGIPLELGNLTQLEVLDLSGNNVSKQDLDQIRSKLLNTKIIE